MRPLMPGDMIPLAKKNLFMEAFASHHYRLRDNLVRSLGYHLVEKKRKVRGPLRHLSQQEIFSLIRERGPNEVLEDVQERYLTFSGDTSPLAPEVFEGTKLLIHECTFLDPADAEAEGGEARYHQHSHLDAVMRHAVDGQVGGLGLYHFSTRYTSHDILAAVQAAIQRYKPTFPVSIALPGAFVDDLMRRDLNAQPTDHAEAPDAQAAATDAGDGAEPGTDCRNAEE
jgi:ribonuclease Z